MPVSEKDLLIQGGSVITVDPELGALRDADVLVRDGKIAAVARTSRPAPAPR